MKKLFIGAALVMMAVAAQARPDRKYGAGGCGLGNMLFGKKDNQVIAVTTNGTSYSQFFGISSGTSNCTDEVSGRSREARAFINLNREAIETDAARGQGEYLETLADILGAQDKSAFSRSVQARYNEIFKSEATSETVVDQMTSLL